MDADCAEKKNRLLLVYTDLGFGGIAGSIVELLRPADVLGYDITLYIRRDDVLDLIHEIPDSVTVITVKNGVKSMEFGNGFSDIIAERTYRFFEIFNGRKRPPLNRIRSFCPLADGSA